MVAFQLITETRKNKRLHKRAAAKVPPRPEGIKMSNRRKDNTGSDENKQETETDKQEEEEEAVLLYPVPVEGTDSEVSIEISIPAPKSIKTEVSPSKDSEPSDVPVSQSKRSSKRKLDPVKEEKSGTSSEETDWNISDQSVEPSHGRKSRRIARKESAGDQFATKPWLKKAKVKKEVKKDFTTKSPSAKFIAKKKSGGHTDENEISTFYTPEAAGTIFLESDEKNKPLIKFVDVSPQFEQDVEGETHIEIIKKPEKSPVKPGTSSKIVINLTPDILTRNTGRLTRSRKANISESENKEESVGLEVNQEENEQETSVQSDPNHQSENSDNVLQADVVENPDTKIANDEKTVTETNETIEENPDEIKSDTESKTGDSQSDTKIIVPADSLVQKVMEVIGEMPNTDKVSTDVDFTVMIEMDKDVQKSLLRYGIKNYHQSAILAEITVVPYSF